MLLRSSSTPVLESLLSSFAESPNNFESSKSESCSDIHSKVSFLCSGHTTFLPVSCNSYLMSHHSLDRESGASTLGFRRAQSDGNLKGLTGDLVNFHNSHSPKPRRRSTVLETIPSFSIAKARGDGGEYEEHVEEEGEFEFGDVSGLERSVTIGENIEPMMRELKFSDKIEQGVFDAGAEAPPLFLARGLGIHVTDPSPAFVGGGGGGGGRRNCPLVDFNNSNDGGNNDSSSVEKHYKKMVEQNPCNPLFLRNYAQFLYQTQRDYGSAEEYYARAILADPCDGEILSQYAKLIWEHHHDEERASSYFEQAIQAAPDDSHVLAAYASFLWETEEEIDESGAQAPMREAISNGAIAPTSA